jgi:ABC-2 type transport system ATP-binding protein
MGDVKQLAKRVIIIDKGKVLFDGFLEEIIKKFANHKTISVVFSKPIDKNDLKGIGKIKEFSPLRSKVMVKRSTALLAASEILQRLPAEDINIEESEIEDVIRELFTGKDYA